MLHMPSQIQKLSEKERVQVLIKVTRALYGKPNATSEVVDELFNDIYLLLDEWVFDGRKTPPYVEEVAWMDFFIKFLQRAEFDGLQFFWGVIYRHFYPRVFLALDALNAWKSNYERLKYFGAGYRYKTPVSAIRDLFENFEKLAYEPEPRHAPDGSLLRREYDRLNADLAKFSGIAHKHAKECKSNGSLQEVCSVKDSERNQVIRVEIADGSVRKLADATGKSVKKAIRPGRGAANERYAFKDELMGIWKRYRDDGALKESLNHKVYHRDVFDYPPAKKEIVALRNDPPIEFEEFNRALGAYSDRKHRKSPAKSNKPQ